MEHGQPCRRIAAAAFANTGHAYAEKRRDREEDEAGQQHGTPPGRTCDARLMHAFTTRDKSTTRVKAASRGDCRCRQPSPDGRGTRGGPDPSKNAIVLRQTDQ